MPHFTFPDNHQLITMAVDLRHRGSCRNSSLSLSPVFRCPLVNRPKLDTSLTRIERQLFSRARRAALFISIKYLPTGEVGMRNRTGRINEARVPQRSGVVELHAVPKLEELVADPGATRMLDPHTADILETTALMALNALHSYRLARAAEAVASNHGFRRDRLLGKEEAAHKLAVTLDWLYRKHKRLPFTVRHGRLLRFSELGIEEYIRKRRG